MIFVIARYDERIDSGSRHRYGFHCKSIAAFLQSIVRWIVTKRPFRKLKGVSKANDDFAVANNRRPFVFSMTLADGGTVESQGSVKPEHCARLGEIFAELHKLHSNADDATEPT